MLFFLLGPQINFMLLKLWIKRNFSKNPLNTLYRLVFEVCGFIFLKNELDVLEYCHFPLILPFIAKFDDDKYSYFLTEFIRGIELFDAIREIGLLDSDQTRFYVASMILTMEYLHYN